MAAALVTLREHAGDVFEARCGALMHCVSADFVMGRGVAVGFRSRFGGVEQLLAQRVPVGGCAHLIVPDGRLVLYLVTKARYNDKPTYDTFGSALAAAAALCAEKGVRQVACPRIGCGLDRLSWPVVRGLISKTFCESRAIAVDAYTL